MSYAGSHNPAIVILRMHIIEDAACKPTFSATVALREWVVRGCIRKFPDWTTGARTQMVQFSATRCRCIDILWVSLLSFAAVTLCVASQRVFVVVYFIIDSVRKLIDTFSYYLHSLWRFGYVSRTLNDFNCGSFFSKHVRVVVLYEVPKHGAMLIP
jgi:hypothetical protein